MLHRHPLYLIVRMLCYDDGLGAGKNLLALKTTDAKQEECSIWVYQCSSSVSVAKYKNLYISLNSGRVPYHWMVVCPFAVCCLQSVWTGAGSVHLQGAVSFFWLCSDVRQVLRPETRTGAEICLDEKWNNCKTNNSIHHRCTVIAKKIATVFLFLPSYL